MYTICLICIMCDCTAQANTNYAFISWVAKKMLDVWIYHQWRSHPLSVLLVRDVHYVSSSRMFNAYGSESSLVGLAGVWQLLCSMDDTSSVCYSYWFYNSFEQLRSGSTGFWTLAELGLSKIWPPPHLGHWNPTWKIPMTWARLQGLEWVGTPHSECKMWVEGGYDLHWVLLCLALAHIYLTLR